MPNISNYRARRRAKCVRLLQHHRANRRAWANRHANWGNAEWSHCLFTDETRFNLIHSDGRMLVWRGPNQRYLEENMAPQEAFGGGGVTVWGGIIRNGKTELFITNQTVNATVYQEEILEPIVVPFARNYGLEFLLVDDNALPHRARRITEFLQAQNTNRMDWPAKSPDLNVIEHVWSYLKLKVRSRDVPPENLELLSEAIREEWENIPQDFINNLVDSLPNRCREVIRRAGGPTKY